jgi:hypothetical protein
MMNPLSLGVRASWFGLYAHIAFEPAGALVPAVLTCRRRYRA